MSVKITNVSQFKKHLSVGMKIDTIFHLFFDSRNADGKINYKDEVKPTREISIVKSNSFAIKTVKTDGKITDSWCSYPSAKLSEFVDNKCIIYEIDREGNKIKVLTYSFPE